MKRIAVLTSGGDAPGMNAAIRAVVRSSLYRGFSVFGVRRGFEGLMNGEVKNMEVSSVSDIMQRGGTVLGTARSDDFETECGRRRSIDILRRFGIDGLVVIGGDGSLRGARSLQEEGIPVIGLPGTIDNDLAYTEFTIGFDTAVNTILSCLSNIRDTSSAHNRSTVIEVMGRNCGDLALYAGLAGGAEWILMPDEELDLDGLCAKILQGKKRGKRHNIILRAEGVKMSTMDVADFIEEKTDTETKIVVLGYIQRGGSPSARDRILASRMGDWAVELLSRGACGRAVGVHGGAIIDMPLAEALAVKKRQEKNLIALSEILSI